ACKPIVNTVQVSSTGDDTFDNTVSELRQKGYNLDSRKYMAWVDANVYCGLGEKWIDDARTTSTYRNLNDGAAGTHGTFARVDTGCWNYAESHEVMHTLGSVQESAPHATTHGHCWDEYDRMCYDDD